MCLYIGIYLFYYCSGAPMPGFLPKVNIWVNWGFLIWGGFQSGRVIVDCLWMHARNEMSRGNMWNGMLLALLQFLPVFLISVFMLKEGFAGK